MTLTIADTYEELSRRIADDLIEIMGKSSNPLLCTASGDTPTGLYRELVRRGVPGNWRFVGLDEWVGMDGSDKGSCRQYTDHHLFDPLHIGPDRIHFFSGKAEDLASECSATEEFITRHGGIDAAILGIGMNGHVGLNEPGVSASLYSHVMAIDPVTQKTGQKYFSAHQELKKGITLGIASLLAVAHPILMASGSHKAEIVKKVFYGEITENIPASLLRTHSGLRVYLDRESASLINENE